MLRIAVKAWMCCKWRVRFWLGCVLILGRILRKSLSPSRAISRRTTHKTLLPPAAICYLGFVRHVKKPTAISIVVENYPSTGKIMCQAPGGQTNGHLLPSFTNRRDRHASQLPAGASLEIILNGQGGVILVSILNWE